MVEIILGGVPPVQNKTNERQGRERQHKKKRPLKDRRNDEKARRREERFGVVVTLSCNDAGRDSQDHSRERSELPTYRPPGA